ncbi:MAG: hypothetical protein O3A57_05015 [Bacteroidetes bacterium]|nr:hypothetical protein [Bacteroidota bacterium]
MTAGKRIISAFEGTHRSGFFRFACKTTVARLRVTCCLIVLVCLSFPGESVSQPWVFGSKDDPNEQASMAWWEAYGQLDLAGGFSLIGPQWRGAGHIDFLQHRSSTSLRMQATLRSGIYGLNESETDEWEDLLRVLQYARWRSIDQSSYVRLGPLNRTRFGAGHLVNFLSSETVWDDRTIGVETQLKGNRSLVEAFTSDVTAASLTGIRFQLVPFGQAETGLGSLRIGLAAVQDFSIDTTPGQPFRGLEGEVRMTAYQSGSFDFVPFASFARIPEYGQGLMVGASLENANFIDMARLHLTLALQYNSSDFRSGYFGSFYQVSNPVRHIAQGVDPTQLDIPLRDVERGNSVHAEARILFFERFELWYAFMRYHGVQQLSEYHLRLFFRAPRFVLSVAQDRRGLKGFASLFGNLGDENRLRFQFDLHLLRQLWVMIDAHYTYQAQVAVEADGADGIRAVGEPFVIQRRFDPLIGLRLQF